MPATSSRRTLLRSLAIVAAAGAALAGPGCRRPRDGKDGAAGSTTVVIIPPSSHDVTDADPLPGLHINVLGVEGGNDDGQFHSGDSVSVTFTLTRDDGSLIAISELDHLEGHISGPTFNYQIVVPEAEDLRETSSANDDGSYTYTFSPLPDAYLDPPNYTGANPTDVLSGESLLGGTYTLVLVAFRNYTVGGSKIVKDVGNATSDFLFGDATTIEARSVVQLENCAQCHDSLQHHTEGLPGGGIMRDPQVCVTCHVAGAEDRNDPSVGGGTPGATIEFKVMIHKIHDGANLPSALGIATNSDGSRDYNAAPALYQLAGDDLALHPFDIQFPVWPNLNIPMPKDYGYTQSTDSATTQLADFDTVTNKYIARTRTDDGRAWRSMDDATRSGATACEKCHGDPDGTGPLAAPAQGTLAFVQPSRRACGSCHDDIAWSKPYRSNLKTMPPQTDDSSCITCHVTGTDPKIDTAKAHVHRLVDSSTMPTGLQGINMKVVDLHPSVGATLDPGEKLEVVFTVKDDAGADIALTPGPYPSTGTYPTYFGAPVNGTTAVFPYPWPSTATGWWNAISCVVSGPTDNYNLLQYVTIPMLHPSLKSGIPVDGEYHVNVPEVVLFERLGRATAGADAFTTSRSNHLNIPFYAPTFVMSRAAVPAASGFTLAAPVHIGQGWIDIVDGAVGNTGAWAKNQFVCVNDVLTTASVAPFAAANATEEYLRIQYVQVDVNGTTNERLWFTSPYQTNTAASAANTAGTPEIGSLPTSGTTWYGPWTRFAHATGEPATRVTITVLASGLTPTVAPVAAVWSLGGPTNDLISEAGAGWTTDATILVSYTGDWQCPTNYPCNFNSGPDLDEVWGEWEGKRVVPGTYTVGLWTRYGWRHVDPDLPPWTLPTVPAGVDPGYNFEVDSYPITSPPASADFLVNNPVLNAAPWFLPVPGELEAYPTITTHGQTCYACHNDIWFHGGGRRGFDTCILCHGLAGTEDWPQYRSGATILPTTGVTINFRTMLHKIHTGKNLYFASTYKVVGNGGSANDFEDIGFPVETGYGTSEGTRNCAKCHGAPPPGSPGTWEVPRNRNHPTDQVVPVREYRAVCNSCHDAPDVTAHIDLNTSSAGEESCATCHGPGAVFGVGIMHKPR